MFRFILLIVLFLIDFSKVFATVLITPEKACLANFTDANHVEKISVLLTDDDLTQIRKLAKTDVKDHVFTFFKIKKDSELLGVGGLYSAKVRAKDHTSITLLNNNGTIVAVEIIAFYEHPEYLPPKGWTKIFNEKKLSDELINGKEIPVISGSTLTTERLSQGARIIRAIWQIKKTSFGVSH